MKHLKKFNENSLGALEPQDLLDFSIDLVDAGYNVEYYTSSLNVIRPDDIISNNLRVQNFDIEYHVRPSALPKPGRIRELLALVSPLNPSL